MADRPLENQPAWSEENSNTFIDLGKYYVPERETQLEILCALVPEIKRPFKILELCCGEGLLARALLERFPHCKVHGLDGSATMLEHARQSLDSYGERFQAHLFNLASSDWRDCVPRYQAILSSLAIHHLDHEQKQLLFRDLFAMLVSGGVLVIADVIQAASLLGNDLAAQNWDAAVRKRALELDGDMVIYERFRNEQWNMFRYLDEMDKPSRLFDQLKWLENAGFTNVDVYWMNAGHVIFGGEK